METPLLKTRSRRTWTSLVAMTLSGLALLPSPALRAATFDALSQRLPAETDAIVAVNVSKILDSDYAKKQEWAANIADNWAKRPQVIPPGVNRLLMGAGFVPSRLTQAGKSP